MFSIFSILLILFLKFSLSIDDFNIISLLLFLSFSLVLTFEFIIISLLSFLLLITNDFDCLPSKIILFSKMFSKLVLGFVVLLFFSLHEMLEKFLYLINILFIKFI